ncbi:hypothetical protein L6452_06442 [Arctium lappa]|uniref:Uncharacterized protein n=1 Tax=Arctium lappa TaxID=4217 RepID=A0ACB9EJP1_ARCLA|nr:hypothetical protein L6452_06442 [Arctium lappa]
MINFLKGSVGVPEWMFTKMSFRRIEDLYKKEMAKLQGDLNQKVEFESKMKERHDLSIQQHFPDSEEGTPSKEKEEVKKEETLSQKIGAVKRMKSIAIKTKAKRPRTEEGEKEQGSERMEVESLRTPDTSSVLATPVSSMLPKIIFWDVCVEKDKHFLWIKRANNRFEIFTNFHQFMKQCSRSDLEEMYSVGMKLYEDRIQQGAQNDTRLIMDWICLMFEPDRIQLEKQNAKIEYYLVEKKYKHDVIRLNGMLQLKLSCGRGSEMENDLIQILKEHNPQVQHKPQDPQNQAEYVEIQEQSQKQSSQQPLEQQSQSDEKFDLYLTVTEDEPLKIDG